MVSLGPDTQSYNYLHMVDFVDYRGKKPLPPITKGSIYEFISHERYSKFRTIVDRAGMRSQLNNSQADFTIFVPDNEFLKHIPCEYFKNMDDGLARQILNSSTLRRRIDKLLLVASPVSYFATLDPRMRMYVTNISNVTKINNCVSVVKYDNILNNGIIHIIDSLIAPSQDTFMN